MALGAWYVRALAVAGALCALLPALAMWGFTVDDALISLRYAQHLGAGLGYRFDATGPSTDGVTPLPWAPLVAPLTMGGASLVVALERAKVLGVLVWTVAGAALGADLARRASGRAQGTMHAVAALAVVALAFPVGAWAASGMETGLATALTTLAAVSFATPRRAALLAGLAAAFRPELVPWSAVLACGAALTATPTSPRSLAVPLLLSAAPFTCCTLVRLAAFGRPAPLALMAKPSDLRHGLVYAAAAAVVVLTPVLAFAPFALRRASGIARTLAIGAVAHVLAVIAVGGDWMPYARLFVPIVPSLAIVFVELARIARPWSSISRAVSALVVGVAMLRAAPAGRQVHEARKELVTRARPELAGARVVAALDIGWIGAATEARIVDLAGLTDPTIAVLPGGHTSKRVDAAMLLDRDVDTVIIYGEPRIVEQRLLHSALFRERFERQATLVFGQERLQRYDVFRVVGARTADACCSSGDGDVGP